MSSKPKYEEVMKFFDELSEKFGSIVLNTGNFSDLKMEM